MAPLDDLSSRHLAKIVDSSDDAIISKDLNGTILSWNLAAERMFGYSAGEAIGRSIRMIIPADRQAEEDYVLGQIRAGQAVRHYETFRQRKDGTQLPISLTVSPIYNDAGVVIGASKIVRDLSERRAADRDARRLAAAVESSDDAIVTKNLDSTITFLEPRCRTDVRVHGRRGDRPVGAHDHSRRSAERRGHGAGAHPRPAAWSTTTRRGGCERTAAKCSSR